MLNIEDTVILVMSSLCTIFHGADFADFQTLLEMY